MATPLPLPVEDQTDEDFFDKLVDDDFGTVGSRPEAGGIARAFSNMSIGDVGDAGFAAEEDEQHENMAMQLIETPAEDANHATLSDEAESVGSEENTAQLGSFACDKELSSRGSVEMAGDVVSPGSSMGRSAGSKGTGVKEVQWSSFSVDSQHLGSGGFGSDSDFLTENLDGSADILRVENDRKSSVAENSLTDPGTYKGSSGLQDAQFYGSAEGQVTNGNDSQYWADRQATNGNDGQYWADGQITNGNDGQYWADGQVVNGNGSQDWENLYPGWKFDSTTGQWYQVDGYDTGMNAHLDSYNVLSGSAQEIFQSNVQEAADGLTSDQETNISYLQQMSKSVVGETIAEDCVTDNVSIWNQVSQGSTEYPPNMVFDPQYPGWYYDTSTQQWHTLESYNQTVQNTAYTLQEQLGQDVNASDGFISKGNASVYNEFGQFEKSTAQGEVNQDTGRDWSTSNYVQQNIWQSEPAIRSVTGVSGNQQTGNLHGSMGHTVNYTNQRNGFGPQEHLPYSNGSIVTEFQSSVPAENIYQYNHPKGQSQQGHFSHNFYGNQNSTNYSQEPFQRSSASYSPLSYAHNEGRSSAGRPPHALVTFGFGGKLVIMKDAGSFGTTLDYGSQDIGRGSISVLSLMEVVKDKTDAHGIITGNCDYFHALCQQTFPGPLVGGNAATKDVNKWIDEKITHCELPVPDFRKGELLRLLLSLLKISCQHYGKLRSPYGTDLSLEETDGPESAVTKLFASARKNGGHQREYVSFSPCMQSLPSEGQIRATAVEVQSLLVSGKRKEALHCAQAGQLWGPALVLSAQLGEKFYVDTVKQMAHRQFISGSPLRTLCLLIAGQPADVFSAESSTNGSLFGAVHAHQQPTQTLTNGMLDEWEENLAIITASRTKDDELVIVHLGDCLWKERGEIAAAHTCYLVAEANFESFSDTARLCLIGADHWKCPRTYASPEAIQRTELYEYSKVLGNSQFILLPFQPYKLIYAYMLAEVGRVSDSLRYCQASLKLLKNSGRSPEVELWKLLLTSLEERLRTHQQGGYSTNLATAKLVGKIFTSIDRSIHRMMGAPPSPLPPMPQSGVNGKESGSIAPKVANSQSTMAMMSLNPSPSVEAISDWPGDGSRKNMHSRSISEPDFGRSPKQDRLKDAGSPDAQGKMSVSGGPTRFGRIGSQLLQKTMGWVSRSRQAKLGESNKFYYDEKLKRWVEEGAEPAAEEAALPPPPTIALLQNGMSDDTISSSFKSQSLVANGEPETKSPIPSGHSSGIPPISPSPNQFSARGRSGVRSRYVDTFNKGGGTLANSFQSPSAPSVKPPVGAKFFTPSPPAASDEQIADAAGENIHEDVANGGTSTSVMESSFSSTPPTLQRFPSMDNIADSISQGQRTPQQNGVGAISSFARAASWSGGYGGMSNPKAREARPLGDGRGAGSPFMPTNPSNPNLGTLARELNGGSFGDELHEVEL